MKKHILMQAPIKKPHNSSPCIVLIAGEPSGDFLGARLMKALKTQLKPHSPKFYGIGGALMNEEGLTSFEDVKNQSIMGFPLNPKILWHAHQTIKEVAQKILSLEPDVVITIDYPGFNLRVAKCLKGHNIPLVHYVAPTVWAWRPKRVEKFAAIFDHLLALFPFEAPYFEKSNLPLTFVGHPLVEKQLHTGHSQRFLHTHAKRLKSFFPEVDWAMFSSDQTVSSADSPLFITVLPGSRKNEVEKLLPIFLETMSLVQRKYPNLCLIVPTVAAVKEKVQNHLKHSEIPYLLLETFDDRIDGYAISHCALAASGTISLELACAHLPMVIAYKVPKVTEWILKKLLTIKYVSMVNILMQEEVVPECLQDACAPPVLHQKIDTLLTSSTKYTAQKRKLKEVVKMLSPNIKTTPSFIAAQTIINILKK